MYTVYMYTVCMHTPTTTPSHCGYIYIKGIRVVIENKGNNYSKLWTTLKSFHVGMTGLIFVMITICYKIPAAKCVRGA